MPAGWCLSTDASFTAAVMLSKVKSCASTSACISAIHTIQQVVAFSSMTALLVLSCRLFITGSVRQHPAAALLCRTIRICHNSKAFAYTSVHVFSALEGLLDQLQLSPANDYVQLTQLSGCISEQCCCSTPTAIQLRLPVHGKAAAAEAEQERLLQLTQQYLEQQLPRVLDGLVCMGQLEECAAEARNGSRAGRSLLR
jgi:hypothetical protein